MIAPCEVILMRGRLKRLRLSLRNTSCHPIVLVGALCLVSCHDTETHHDNASHDVALTWPEGGEIRIEYVKSADGELSRGIAFFKSNQEPQATLFPPIRHASEHFCQALLDEPAWPTAPYQSASYLDVGDLSLVTNNKKISFSRIVDQKDFLGRHHPIAYGFNSAAEMIPASALYDVIFSGSNQVKQDEWPKALAVPFPFELEPEFDKASIEIIDNQDYTLRWQHPKQTIDAAIFGLIAFKNAAGTLTHLCLTDDVENDFVVSKNTVVSLPETGSILRGHTTHQLIEYPQGRRFDLIGTWCYVSEYKKVSSGQ